tara:strand:+ start:132 stop:296 length:165 start_codon:yes stop_codon:yes gene_type:complete
MFSVTMVNEKISFRCAYVEIVWSREDWFPKNLRVKLFILVIPFISYSMIDKNAS